MVYGSRCNHTTSAGKARKYLNEENGAKIVAMHQDNSSKGDEKQKKKDEKWRNCLRNKDSGVERVLDMHN